MWNEPMVSLAQSTPQLEPALICPFDRIAAKERDERYARMEDIEAEMLDFKLRGQRLTAKIFISYRRVDGAACREADRLRDRFGEKKIFMDVDAIALGTSYDEIIEARVWSSAVLLAVVTRGW